MKKVDFSQNWLFYKEGSERKHIHVPHDAMQYEKRAADNPSGAAGAFFTGGVYYYEKKIENVSALLNKHLEIVFEGVYKDAEVYLDGELLAEHAYGYTPFSVVLDGKLDEAKENILLVKVNNQDMPNSRWYTGSGIYRPVSMYVSEKEHIALYGVKIKTVSIHPPKIKVSVEHNGEEIEIAVRDGENILAVSGENNEEIELPSAQLWDENNPYLYDCHVKLKKNGSIVDEARERFGIRTISWDAKGFYINGKNTLLRGACVHHDNGILGARSYAVSEERRVRILKEAGYNAIRSSHNPASEDMIRACDKYGIYMMDETWDVWYKAKNAYDYSKDFLENYQEDVRAMVGRDYNHPSVVMYSIANEVSEPAQTKGLELAKEIIDLIHKLDDMRPVTGGMNLMIMSRSADGNDIYQEGGGRNEDDSKKASEMNSLMFNIMTSMIGSGMNKAANSKKADQITTPVLDALDIAGYNYASGRYPKEGKKHPNRIIFGSETFPGDIAKNWAMVKRYPYLIGDFMWTGWDYLGEAGSGAWAYTADAKGFEKPYPWLLADMGAIDILGNPTGELYLAQAAWGKLKTPVIAVRPVNHPNAKLLKSAWRGSNAYHSWAWKDCEGNPAVIEVYGNGNKAELFLNGKSIGKKRLKEGRAIFKTKYASGNIQARIYDESGKMTGEDKLCSAGRNLQMKLVRETDAAVVREPVYIDLSICDEKGIVESNCDKKIKVKVEGGKLLAFGSANPRTEENYLSGEFITYYGKAQIIVLGESAGEIKVIAEGDDLKTESIYIPVKEEGRLEREK